MPVGTRDILLIIRAKDQASRVIRDVGLAFDNMGGSAEAAAMRSLRTGAALVGVGVGIAAIGAKGISVLVDWTKEAINYNKQAALTLTQVDQLGVSVKDIQDIGLRVASTIAAPLEQLQPALFDIFSSMDVSVADAEKILTSFAKTAVAGNVDVQTAGRQTIAIMNGFGLSTADLGHIQDVNFQLVRKGVGTYDEFAKSIGRSIPSARRADQSYETLAGTLAFLTRNGLSTAMASTTAARAMDTLANPVFAKHMNDLGISVFDATGKFRPLNDVATDLGKSLTGLTDKQKAQALADLFKGAGGTIQSRRFWDLAINHFQQLNSLTGDMVNSSGALDRAYKIMFDQPATKLELLKNQWKVFKISIGEALIPVVQKLVEWGGKVLEWLNAIPEATKKTIAVILAIASAGLVVVGVLMTLIGLFALFWGAIQLIGGIGVVVGMLATLGFWILAIAAAAYVIYRNWDTIKSWWVNTLWPAIRHAAEVVINWLRDNVPAIWDAIREKAEEIWPKVQAVIETAAKGIVTAWEEVKKKAQEIWPQVWDAVQTGAPATWDKVKDLVQTTWQKMQDFWDWLTNYFGPGIQKIWQSIKDNAGPIWEDLVIIVTKAVQAIAVALYVFWAEISLIWSNIHTGLRTIADTAWKFIYNLIANYLLLIRGYLDVIAGLLTLDWARVHQGLQEIAQAAWNAIQNVVATAMGLILGIVQIGLGLLYTQAQMTWELMKAGATLAWTGIKNAVGIAVNAVVTDVTSKISFLLGIWSTNWNTMSSIVSTVWNTIKSIVTTVMGTVISTITNAINLVKSIWSSFWNSLPGPVQSAAGAVAGAAGTIAGIISGIVSAVNGMVSTVQRAAGLAVGAVNAVKSAAAGVAKAALGPLSGLVPGLAVGGPVYRNAAYIVGELGPEIFIPNQAGYIVPNSVLQTAQTVSEIGNIGGAQLTLNFFGPTNSDEITNVVHREFRALVTSTGRQ